MYLPTKQDCDLIVQSCDAFKRKADVINGIEVVQYSYLLASLTDFTNPIPGNPIDAFELRGITFVGDKRYLMLRKFWMLNQTIGSMYDDVKNKEIKRVQDKVDGSMIRFVRIGDKAIAKTKFSFQSEQAQMAQEIYNTNERLREFVDKTLDLGYAAIFELESPMNRIVVLYPTTELILLQIRNEETGEYFDLLHSFKNLSLPPVCSFIETKPLDEYVELCKTLQGKEGFVITFNDGQMIKLKTDWYLNLHGLVTTGSEQPHKIVQMIMNNQFDDSYSQIPVDFTELRELMLKIEKVTMDWIRTTVEYCKKCLKEFNSADRKTFALKYKEDKFFSIMTNSFRDSSDEAVLTNVKTYLSKRTSKLTDCINFLKEQGLDINIKKESELE